ncbi:HAD family hydrolase [Phototrophicus methaneseepsis]|uniref:HAD family hydrolase n=1 Tax=Phototrophicus methaneseepsis TaxID=2710758 RepID=A0A7S8EDM9_9CHLR|nr:HAD family hydrolase [Phototrophicus methaneseepsis]QPC85044.1 HAD family hydrolase [Phototrophicus methaneseepsis]
MTTAQRESATKRKNIKLIVVDIDGTLLNDEHVLSDRNREALRKAIDSGIKVVIATGKSRGGNESVLAALNLDTPGIYVQGLMICDPQGGVLHQQTLDPALARRVITFAEQRGFDVVAYSGNRLVTKMSVQQVDEIAKYHEPVPEPIGPLVNHLGLIPMNKLLILGDPRKLKALRWQLEKQLDGQVSFTSTNVLNTLEVLPLGASKGKALKVLIHDMGIAPEHVMVIGDGENDIEMLKLAGFGVAVGNANPKLQAIADEIVSTNNESGVAEAIEKFILPDPKPEQPEATAKAEESTETEKDDAEASEELSEKPEDAS